MLIPFHSPDASDSTWVRPLLQSEGLALCDYSFPVLFCWKDAYGFQYAPLGKRLLVRLTSSLGHSYLWPAGEGDPTPALDALTQDARAEGQPLRLIALTLYHKNWLEDHYPGRFCFEEARDGFDYLYSVDRLADRETVRGLSTLDDEHRALVLALEHLPALGLEGIVLRWQDTLLGFTLGAPLTETIFDVHFERARGEIQGAYPAVNRSFARYIRQKYPHIRYLDREDDMGLPGLRKAKLSYAPDYLQVNFSAVECRAP